MKFCSYSFLNKVPNSNDIICVAIIMFNEAPNSSDAVLIANNVHLTTMGAKQFSMAAM